MSPGRQGERWRDGKKTAFAHADVVHAIPAGCLEFKLQPRVGLGACIQFVLVEPEGYAVEVLILVASVENDVTLANCMYEGIGLSLAIKDGAVVCRLHPVIACAESAVPPPAVV